jgi:transposase
VPISAPYSLTKCRRFFTEPATARQRQYEALRAFYLERLPSAEVARRFGYSPGAFRVLCHAFRHADLPEFFATAHPGPREQPKKSRAHEQIVALRKRNYSVYEISQALKEQGTPLSATAVREVLAEEGFAPAGSMRSGPRASVPMPKPSPMSRTSPSQSVSSPPGWEGCSCSFPI